VGAAVIDSFENYITNNIINGSSSGEVTEPYISWSAEWKSITPINYGVLALDTFEEYTASLSINGSGSVSDSRWTQFSGSWKAINAS
jgi:hypothetical protein